MFAGLRYRLDRTLLGIVVSRANHRAGFRERLEAIDATTFALTMGPGAPFHWFRVEDGLLLGPEPQKSREADFVLEGSWRVFWRVARRRLDSDAAFFNRELTIYGAPKNALVLKNIYDSLT